MLTDLIQTAVLPACLASLYPAYVPWEVFVKRTPAIKHTRTAIKGVASYSLPRQLFVQRVKTLIRLHPSDTVHLSQ